MPWLEMQREVEVQKGHLEVNLKVHGLVGVTNARQHLPAKALNGLLLAANLLAQQNTVRFESTINLLAKRMFQRCRI